jgi:trigger factor
MIVKNVEKKEKSTVSFDVLCDAAEFEKAINAAYLKNKSKIFVQGFRKGKAPRMVIEGMYGKDVFYEEATDELAPTAFTFAAQQENLRTVGTPTVAKVDVSDAAELTISFLTAVWPEVTLGQYKGVEAPRAAVNVTDEQVDAEMAKIQKRNARIVAVERPAQNGDTATIDYEGSVDGVPFDGGKAEGYGLVLGSNTFIPGFEDQVVGMSAGEEKDINVTFPEEYHEPSLAGKPAVFHVKVSEVKEEQLPALDDEFAKDVSEFDTLADYRNAVKNRIEVSEKDAAEADFQNALIEKAGDSITAEIPDAMVEEQIDSMIREYDQNLQMNGLNLQMYMQYIGQDITAFRAQCRPTAERRVKTELLLDKIAEVEGIEVTAEEIAEEYQKVADQYDTDLDTVKNAVPESAIVGDMKARRAAELIFNTGVPTEPVAPAAEETAEQAPAEEKKPAKKTTRKTTKKAAAEAPAEETAE